MYITKYIFDIRYINDQYEYYVDLSRKKYDGAYIKVSL